MDDLPIRLAKALAPKPPSISATQTDRSLAAKYASAYNALFKQNRFDCQSILLKLRVRLTSSNPPSAYQTYLLCKVLLLSATFDHKLTGFDALEKMHYHLLELRQQMEYSSGNGVGKLIGIAIKELDELWELRDEMETRLLRERDVEYVKETSLRYGTTTWEVRMTEEWLEQTAGKR
ncbi:MAG: hypothetical protein LQ343_000703 [Gyalolechia ehrenbergii]|nr:MAG: hypothetical protein LQ343_000703 [Gyalolechia ehrenbergii]